MIRSVLILIGILLNTYTNIDGIGYLFISIGIAGFLIQYLPYPKRKEPITYSKDKFGEK